jgi:hypothetical protein
VSNWQPAYPSRYEEEWEEDGTTIWPIIGCGAIVALGGLCVCGLIFSVAFLSALPLTTPTPSLARLQQPTPIPLPKEPAPSPTPFPSPNPSPSPQPVSPTAPPTPQLSRGDIRQRVEMDGIGLTVTSAKGAGHGQFICYIVEVTIENVGHDMLVYSPADFRIMDSQGLQYATACATNGQALKPGALSKGGQVQGEISFQVLQDATNLLLVYQQLSPSGGYRIIEIDLGL